MVKVLLGLQRATYICIGMRRVVVDGTTYGSTFSVLPLAYLPGCLLQRYAFLGTGLSVLCLFFIQSSEGKRPRANRYMRERNLESVDTVKIMGSDRTSR